MKIFRKFLNSPDKKRLFSNFVSLAVLQGANYILPLITFPYLVRVLGVEKFGLLAFATATVTYFQILTDYGFNLSATRDISIHRENKEKVQEIFSSVMVIKFGLLILSFILLIILVFSFDKFRKDWEVFVLSFGMVVGQVLFPVWFFQGMEKMKYITILNIFAKLLFTVAIFVFVKEQADYWKVPLLNSLGFILAGVLALWIIFRDFGIKFPLKASKNNLILQLKKGFYLFLSSGFLSLYRSSNSFIIGLILNNTYVGYYSIAEKIIYTIQSLQDIVGRALYPYFAKKFRNAFEFTLFFKKIVFLLVTIYLSITLLTISFSTFLIILISGKDEIIISNLLRIMSIVILVGGLNYWLGILGFTSLGNYKIFMNGVLIAGISNLALCVILLILIGIYGAGLSLLLSEIILLIYLSLNLRKIIKIEKVAYERNLS
ncbi:flippase [Sulfurihydrogenibium azorense]|uniref:flippase n=1 Tax=Sulfurihydrogenibium azorense TaxID=309806 RepID=UPI00391AA92F